jgi:competence protein ComEC
MLINVIAFLGGILVVQTLADLPSLMWALLLLPLIAVATRWRSFLPLVFFGAGFFWALWRADLILQQHLPADLEGQDVWVEGRVADVPRLSERGLRFVFAVERAQRDDVAVALPTRIQLSTYDPRLTLRAGEAWGLTVRLKRPHGFQNPGGYDYESHLFRNRIRATGYVRADPPPKRLDHLDAYPVDRFRQAVGEGIAAALPGNDFAALLIAFANGDESRIGDEQWRVLQRTGTAHLVAISGMNVSFVAGLVFLLLRRLWAWPGVTVLWWPAPKVAAVGALFAAAGYSALAGFAIPTQRALVMLAVVMVGIVFQRRWPPSYVLAAALFAVLVYDPLAVLSAGFWLSFVAVGVMIYALRAPAQGVWRQWSRAQMVVSLGLLPLMIALFQQTALVGPLANLIAIPVIELAVIPLTLASVLVVTWLPTLAAPLLTLAAWVLEYLWVPLVSMADLAFGQWVQHQPAPWTILAAAIGVAWLLAPRGWPARWVGWLWLLPMLMIVPPGPKPGEVWFGLLDVGQGLSAVVRTAEHVLVYDAGARFSSRFDSGSDIVWPYLRRAGVQRIDTLMISHGDADHAGGVTGLLASLSAQTVLSSVPQRFAGAQACEAGQAWRWDGVEFTVLSPPPGGAGADNNASCVLRVASLHGRVLLAGDIEAETEATLVATAGEALRAEVLVVPHHGSKTSSTRAFLEQTRPHVALFPVGYRNRYHHPHPMVIARYRDIDARLYDSPAHGEIEVYLRGKGVEVMPYRAVARRYWHAR